jgi:tRNA(Ile)-lysidine synthase
MIKLLGTVPSKIVMAVSGGQDSMAALDFLANDARRKVVVLYFNHGTDHGNDAEIFVKHYCGDRSIPLVIGGLQRAIEPGESKEAYWREERYGFFKNWLYQGEYNLAALRLKEENKLAEFNNAPIITCHHLDDAVETWIFTALHGNPMLIPYKRDNFIRPFLLTRKSDLAEWSERKEVQFVLDQSNFDTSYMRNFIRHNLMPNALTVNPGLHKVIKKKVLQEYNKNVDII